MAIKKKGENVGYNINYDDIYSMETNILLATNQSCGIYGSIYESFRDFVNNEDFTGKGAEALKNYVQDVHITICEAIQTILSCYSARALLYSQGFAEYESEIHAVLNEDALADVEGKLTDAKEAIGESYSQTKSIMNGVSDLVDSSISTVSSTYTDALYTQQHTIEMLKDNITAYEEMTYNESSDLRELISSTLELVKELNSKGMVNVLAYESSTVVGLDELSHVKDLVYRGAQYLSDNETNIQDAFERYQVLSEKLKEEATRERIKNGLVKVISGTIMLVTVLATAATMPLVGGFIFGTMTATYNTFTVIEGGVDVVYGIKGDAYTEAWNPLLDIVFDGNRGAYDVAGIAINSLYSMAVPLNEFGAIASSPSILNVRLKEEFVLLQDTAIGWGTDSVSSYICEEAGFDDLTATLFSINAGVMVGHGLNNIRNGGTNQTNISAILDKTNSNGETGYRMISYTAYDEIYQSSIHNAGKDKVMLGKYDGGGPTSYIARAGDEYTYFDLGMTWGKVQIKYCLTNEEMFELFNTSFLDDGIIERKVFYFSHNPIYDKGALKSEFIYLQQNGYVWDDITMTMRPRE